MSIYGLFNGVDYRQLLDHFDPVVKSKNMVDNFVNLIAQVKTSRPIFMSLRYPRGREKSFPRYHHRSNGSVSLLEERSIPERARSSPTRSRTRFLPSPPCLVRCATKTGLRVISALHKKIQKVGFVESSLALASRLDR